jgi:lipid-binding SYLF domain-containing protein
VKLTQASIGAQIGGDTYAELIIFQDEHALNRMMNNSIEFGADANATIVKDGAAGSASFAHGVQIYVLPKGGLKAGVSVNGQKFHFMQSDAQANPNTPQ